MSSSGGPGRTPLAGAILCGGRSSRMGVDKATLRLWEESLLERVARRLGSVASPLILCAGRRRVDRPRCVSVVDPLPDRGPLGGLAAALGASPHRLCAVVGVDMPDLSPALLRALAARWRGEQAVVPRVDGRPQPLHAVWSRDALPAVDAALRGDDLSLRALLGRIDVRHVDAEDLVGAEEAARCALSLNTPEDLDGWLTRAADSDLVAAADPVRIVPYDPTWPARFEEERRALQAVLGERGTGGIHHVGSTAVPGLAAKPIIDMLVGVADLESSWPCVAAVARLGYHYAPYRPTEMHWLCKPDPRHRTHHLHLVPVASPRFREELAFRDHLRRHRDVAARYETLKRALAAQHGADRDAYTAAKAPFIAAVLRQAFQDGAGSS
jgi:GrpB-like predicted nucleotidyltransferase (UPF0157 family)/molybdopterin-guanine dinucleotide biosynthesis protein A